MIRSKQNYFINLTRAHFALLGPSLVLESLDEAFSFYTRQF